MTFDAQDAPRFNKKTLGHPHLQAQWAEVVNSVLANRGTEAEAIKAANSAVKHIPALPGHQHKGVGH